MKIALAALLALTPVSAFAGEYDPGGYSERMFVIDMSIVRNMFLEHDITPDT